MSHVCKRIFKFELQLRSYWQNIKFSWNCPKFNIFTEIVIFQVYLQLFRPTAASLKILWQGHVRNTLFHFCQLWAVKGRVTWQNSTGNIVLALSARTFYLLIWTHTLIFLDGYCIRFPFHFLFLFNLSISSGFAYRILAHKMCTPQHLW